MFFRKKISAEEMGMGVVMTAQEISENAQSEYLNMLFPDHSAYAEKRVMQSTIYAVTFSISLLELMTKASHDEYSNRIRLGGYEYLNNTCALNNFCEVLDEVKTSVINLIDANKMFMSTSEWGDNYSMQNSEGILWQIAMNCYEQSYAQDKSVFKKILSDPNYIAITMQYLLSSSKKVQEATGKLRII